MESKGLYVKEWEETTKKNMPLKQWLQEYECDGPDAMLVFLVDFLCSRWSTRLCSA